VNLIEAIASGAIRRMVVFADDLTGAAATAARFTTLGAQTNLVAWGGPRQPTTTVTVLDTGTRGLPVASAVERVAGLAAETADDTLIVLRVDTTLRGHCADELTALRAVVEERSGPVRVVLAPAFPTAGRTTQDGRQWKPDPDTPDRMVPASPEALTTCFDIGAHVLNPHDDAGHLQPAEDVVVDARDEDDLAIAARRIAGSPGHPWLVVDSGSFAPVLAREAGLIQGGSPVLIVRGSREQVSHDQVTVAHRLLGGLRLSVDPAGVGWSVERIAEMLDDPPPLITIEPLSATPQDAARVADALATVAAEAVAHGISKLVLIGGHTAAAVLSRLGVGQLRPLLEPFPLGALSASADGRREELLILTKGGMVGHDLAVVTAVALLNGYEASTTPASPAPAGGRQLPPPPPPSSTQ
jgi:D-threonate/D-erythronate kinase